MFDAGWDHDGIAGDKLYGLDDRVVFEMQTSVAGGDKINLPEFVAVILFGYRIAVGDAAELMK